VQYVGFRKYRVGDGNGVCKTRVIRRALLHAYVTVALRGVGWTFETNDADNDMQQAAQSKASQGAALVFESFVGSQENARSATSLRFKHSEFSNLSRSQDLTVAPPLKWK